MRLTLLACLALAAASCRKAEPKPHPDADLLDEEIERKYFPDSVRRVEEAKAESAAAYAKLNEVVNKGSHMSTTDYYQCKMESVRLNKRYNEAVDTLAEMRRLKRAELSTPR